MSNKCKEGISLIVLVITIIVIIILAAAVILTLTANNPISEVNKAKYINDLASFVDELNMYKAKMYAQTSGEFLPSTINATDEELYTYIPSMQGKTIYLTDLAISGGELVYIGENTIRKGWAETVNISDKIPPQNPIINLTVASDTINGNITLIDNESGINLNQSKYLITTQSTLYATDATEWNTATEFSSNPQNISTVKENGNYYIQVLSVDNSGNKKVNVSEIITVLKIVANPPVLATGMTPIKWNGSAWINTTAADNTWYNYDLKQWANAKTADGSMWVWIPRYEYKILTPNISTAQTIAINFVNGTSNVANNGYLIHQGFKYSSVELTGIWVAKFEASGDPSNISIKSGVSAIRNYNVDSIYTGCKNMEKASMYGWGTSGTGIHTHLIKNLEWGAAAYLSQSIYGKNSEIWINPNSNCTTGNAGTSVNAVATLTTYGYTDTTYGVNASTTGNVYGIYDMSGGAYEYTAAISDNIISSLTASGYSLYTGIKDCYQTGSGDTSIANYNANIGKIKGSAVYETSTAGTGSTSWYGDNSNMPYSNAPVFLRGGCFNSTSKAGIFAFDFKNGYAYSDVGFRPALVVSAGF